MKKNTVLGAALISAMAITSVAPAAAGNLATPEVESAVVVADDAVVAGGLGSTGAIIGGLVALAIIGAVASSSGTN